MIYLECTAKEITEKYGILVEKMQCDNCKQEITCDVPIRMKGYVGLEMREHGCPRNFLSANFVPIGKERDEWKSILGV